MINTKAYVIKFPTSQEYMGRDSHWNTDRFLTTERLAYAQFFDSYETAEEYYNIQVKRFINCIKSELPRLMYPHKYGNLSEKTLNETKEFYLKQLSLFGTDYKIVCLEDKISDNDSQINKLKEIQ